MVGGRRDRGLYGEGKVSGGVMWLKVGETERRQCVRSRNVAGGRGDRGQYDGRNVSGARMWLEVRETGDCMMDAICQEPGCGWR